MNFEFTKRNTILLIIFILLIAIGLYIHDYRNQNTNHKESIKITLVNNYSHFFTISNAGNKYINYLKEQDKNNLMLLLNDKYIEINNITKNNVLEKLNKLEPGEYSFEARKMYQENLTEDLIRYYLYGHLNKIIMDGYQKPDDYYLIIDLDNKNNTYAVTPYNGEIFKEES